MQYVDGFVLPVPKGKIKQYQKIASKAGKIWMEHGALEYRECVLEDPRTPQMLSFPQLASPKKGETVILAYIVYKSRAHRDKVNAKVMKDKRLMEMCPENDMPFDCKRMAYGGFATLVSY